MTRLISLSHRQHRATQTCYPTEMYLTQETASVLPPRPWTTHLHHRARLEMAQCQANPPTIPILSVIGEGRKWTHLFWPLVCFRGHTNRTSVSQLDRASIPALCTIKSWQDMTWNLYLFFFFFVGFELPCFFIYFFPLIIWPWGGWYPPRANGGGSTVDRAGEPRPRRTQFHMKIQSAYGFPWWLFPSLPLINSEAPVIHAMSTLALFSWPTPPASILTLESCRTVIPTASEHGVCKIPSQGVLVLTIYLWSQDKSWAFSTVDTMMGPQCRGMRAADLSLTGPLPWFPGCFGFWHASEICSCSEVILFCFSKK